MSNILLTGASGFVGKNLVPYLTNLMINVKQLTRGELTAVIDLQNSSAIIHLAGKAHDLKKTSNPDEYYEVNFQLTKKLYDAFLASTAQKFIFISSVKAVADITEGTLTEETIPNPQTDYGKSKLMAEEYIKNQALPDGKSFYILRPCMIHGPGNKGNLNLLYKFVQKGIPYPLAAFKNKRSFLSVENLCFVIAKLLERDVSSGIYNVADNEALSTNEVVDILAKSLDRKPKLWAIPTGMIRKLAKVGDLIRLPLNSERLKKLTENYIVSNNKIKKVIGSDLPLRTNEGLEITAKSFNRP